MENQGREQISKGIQIRRITPDDWQVYKNIRLEMLDSDPDAFPKQAFNDMRDHQGKWVERIKNGIVIIAFDAEKPIGMVRGIPALDSRQATIKNMYVNKDYRGQKIGESLLENVLGNLENLGILKVLLEVEDTQESAIKMYQKHGFTESARIKQEDRDGEMIIMEKRK